MSAISDYDPKKRKGAGTTFREDEVEAMHRFFQALRQGKDVSVILRSEVFRSVERKFSVMQQGIQKRNAARQSED